LVRRSYGTCDAAPLASNPYSYAVSSNPTEKTNMTSGRKIVFFGVGLPRTREQVVSNLPEGYELAFGEANPDRTLTEQAYAEAVDANYLVFWTAGAPTRVIETATKAKLILNLGEGTELVDVATAARLGIPVAKTAGENSTSTAELTTLLMLA